jgi:ribosomal protein L11 methyltransferase
MIPYDKLHIYEIDGTVRRDESEFPPDYMGTWWEEEHSFLFFSQKNELAVESLLENDPSLHLIDQFAIDYRDWQGGEEIQVFRVGKMVFIPFWEDLTPSTDEIPIFLDPGVVFGTGLHPTTHSCLEAIWQVYQTERP